MSSLLKTSSESSLFFSLSRAQPNFSINVFPLPPFLPSAVPLSGRPVHGLIFLYKWRAEEPAQGSVVQDSRLEDIFFAKQVMQFLKTHRWREMIACSKQTKLYVVKWILVYVEH